MLIRRHHLTTFKKESPQPSKHDLNDLSFVSQFAGEQNR